jgi:uncharacterized protein YdhG (YjbR/CyaY superfamily)
VTVIDEHLEQFDDPQRAALAATVATIRKALPGAVEVISYGMPTFKLEDASGPAVVGLDGFAKHNSLFPYSGRVLEQFATELGDRIRAKGTIGFDRDRAFPAPLLKRILAARIEEVNGGYPKSSGQMREFYDNGTLKLRGRMKADRMHGKWEWFRRDGTILRSGSFRDGEQTGEWVTYDRAGLPHKTTHF